MDRETHIKTSIVDTEFFLPNGQIPKLPDAKLALSETGHAWPYKTCQRSLKPVTV